MKWLLAWMLVASVAQAQTLDLPCQPRGEVLLARFRGFPDIPDHDVFFHSGGEESFELADSSITDAELISPTAQVEWLVGFQCVSAYTYQYPGILFPDGSKYDRFQLRWGRLCADLAGCGAFPFTFPNDNLYFVWHGEQLPILDTTRNFSTKWHGATLTIYEVISRHRYAEINGVHMELPGQGEVWLSRVVQECP